MLMNVTKWASENGYAPSTARKWALILDMGFKDGVSRIINDDEQATLAATLQAQKKVKKR